MSSYPKIKDAKMGIFVEERERKGLMPWVGDVSGELVVLYSWVPVWRKEGEWKEKLDPLMWGEDWKTQVKWRVRYMDEYVSEEASEQILLRFYVQNRLHLRKIGIALVKRSLHPAVLEQYTLMHAKLLMLDGVLHRIIEENGKWAKDIPSEAEVMEALNYWSPKQ